MKRTIGLLAVAALCTFQSTHAGDLFPHSVASQLGMEEVWKRYLPVPAGADSIIDQQLYVNSENPHEYVEVSAPVPEGTPAYERGERNRVWLRIATDQLNAAGEPIGKKEAERLALHEVLRLKRRGFAPVVTTRVVPRVHLYTLGNDGTCECRDAETGEPIWMTRVGDRNLSYFALGVSEDHVSVINGPNLIQLDASNGETMEEVRMMGTPLHGAVHAGNFAMVPTIRDGVEGYPMRDPTIDPFMEVVNGIALTLPTIAPGDDTTRVAWGTSKGYVYVMEMSGEPSVLFRLDTDGIVSGRIAAADGNRFFFGSEAGQVYAIRATRIGKVLWSVPFGEPFYNAPMVVGSQVLIRSTYGNLYSLAVDSGKSTWASSAPSIDELIGAIGDNLYVRTLSGSLAVLNLKTGERIRTYDSVRPGRLLINIHSDRLYMVSDGGAVQCLRPEGHELPSFTQRPDIEIKEEEVKPAAPQAPATPDNPFGAGNPNPFGDAAPADNPFGDNNMDGGNPFGDAGGDNPFGADPNPFGN